MKDYTSCFLGIPLPQKYLREFEQLLNDINAIDSFIEIVQPHEPHLTIYYLNKQSQYSLAEINKVIQPFTDNLSGVKLKIGGFNYFTQNNPKVLFLDVKYPDSLLDFRNKISEVLMKYNTSDNSLPFHPHMTLGRIKNIQAQENFKVNEKKLSLRLNAINWDFNINEIALYGVDSTKLPELQEKLITIPVA